MKVMVETSAHHVHVSEADLEALFGKGAALTNKKDLSQPGQFACEEKVEVVGPKGTMKMSSWAPPAPDPGGNLPHRCPQAGRHRPHPGGPAIWRAPLAACSAAPAGEVTLEKGVIAAKRHIHFKPRRGQRGRRGGQAGGLRQGGLQRPQPDFRRRACAASAPSMPWPCTWTPTSPNAAALPGTVDGEIIL